MYAESVALIAKSPQSEAIQNGLYGIDGKKALSSLDSITPPSIASAIICLAYSVSSVLEAIRTAIRSFNELAYLIHLLKSPLYMISYSATGTSFPSFS